MEPKPKRLLITTVDARMKELAAAAVAAARSDPDGVGDNDAELKALLDYAPPGPLPWRALAGAYLEHDFAELRAGRPLPPPPVEFDIERTKLCVKRRYDTGWYERKNAERQATRTIDTAPQT